jgi:hypothetical protein
VDDVLKEELGPMYIAVPGFFEAFFGKVAGLEPAAKAMFEKCKEGGLIRCTRKRAAGRAGPKVLKKGISYASSHS